MNRLGRAVVLACLLLLPGRQAMGEWAADIVDMEWSPQRFVAVDKKAQSFALLTRQSPLKVLQAIPCATGQELGDKFKEGDLKTPEGVYFITRRKSAGLNYELYGDLAFPLNFPNPADVVRRKSGHGIWIHGRGHAIIPYETQGCVALSTPDIHRVDAELGEGMPVVIADEVRIGGSDAAKLRDEAREVVEATKGWAKAWENRSDAFFDFHDPEKFSLTEGKSFASFRSHKERLFRSLPWIKVDISDLRAIAGPDYWVTYFVQFYRSPTLASQGIKRLYWQRGSDGRFRIIGMEYEEMPVTLAANTAKSRKGASPDEIETDTRKPDSPSEEEVQARQLVDAHQAVMEKVAQKAFASLHLKTQPTPEDQAMLEVAETGATKPGFSPFATDALRQSPPPATVASPQPAKEQPVAAKEISPAAKAEASAPAAVAAPAPAVSPLPASVQVAAVTPPPALAAKAEAPAQAASIAPAATTAAPKAQPAAKTEPAVSTVAASAPTVTPAQAATVAAMVEAWRAAWERGDINGYMAHYADGARQGNLRGKEAIRRQKEGVWRGVSPGRVAMDVLAVAPEGEGYEVVCAMTYQGKGRRESKGFKSMTLVSAGGGLRIAEERWSRNRPEIAAPAVAPAATASAAQAVPAKAAPIALAASAPAVTAAASNAAPTAPAAQPGPAAAASSLAAAPVSAPTSAPAIASAPAPATSPVAAKAERTSQVAALVESWRKAWESGRADAYAGYYAAEAVQGDRRGRTAIRDQKADLWKDKAPKEVKLSEVKIRPRKDGYVVTCVQEYKSRDGGSDRGLKTLYLAPSAGGYAIVEEKWSRL